MDNKALKEDEDWDKELSVLAFVETANSVDAEFRYVVQWVLDANRVGDEAATSDEIADLVAQARDAWDRETSWKNLSDE
jgi:hypothetical protein